MKLTQRQIVIISAIVIGLAIIGLIVYALIPRARLQISSAPDQVTVVVDGREQTIDSGEFITVSPGEFDVTIQRDQFEPYTETVSVENGDEYEILVALNPLTPEAEELLRTPTSIRVIERIGARNVERGAQNLVRTYPLLGEIPIVDRFYRVDVCDSQAFPNDRTKVAFCVRLFNLEARQAALDDITSRGYNLEDYEIIVQDESFETRREQAGE